MVVVVSGSVILLEFVVVVAAGTCFHPVPRRPLFSSSTISDSLRVLRGVLVEAAMTLGGEELGVFLAGDCAATMLWVDLGGKCKVVCRRNGFRRTVRRA